MESQRFFCGWHKTTVPLVILEGLFKAYQQANARNGKMPNEIEDMKKFTYPSLPYTSWVCMFGWHVFGIQIPPQRLVGPLNVTE